MVSNGSFQPYRTFYYSMGTTCSQTLPRPLDPTGETRIRFSKEDYPALCDEDFEWMKKTKGGLVVTGEDRADLESPNAKVHRFETEEALQKFIEGRQLVDTTVIRWYNVYSVPQYDTLFTGCHNVDATTGCVRVVYPITIAIKGREEVDLQCIVDTGAPASLFYDSLYADDPNQASGTQAIGSELYTSQSSLCSVTINKTKVPRRLPLTLVDRKVKGYDGLIGYDLLEFCHMTVYRGKSLLVVSPKAN